MMTSSKDRLRKIHGVTESTAPADQAVLARRKYHEAAANWLARISFFCMQSSPLLVSRLCYYPYFQGPGAQSSKAPP